MPGERGKILNHPDKDEIIRKLVSGISPNAICTWLKEKYPTEAEHHHCITTAALSTFRRQYLNLDRDAVKIIKAERQKKAAGLPHNENAGTYFELPSDSPQERDQRVKESLLNSPTYVEQLKAISQATLDGPRLIRELVGLVQSRLEVYYNEVAKSTSVGETLKNDRMFAEYINLTKDLIKDAKKIDDDYNAQPDEGVVQLNVVHEQVGMIREVVKELLAEFAPELALEFMDRLNKKMTALKYTPPQPGNVLAQVERLTKKIEEIREANQE